MPRRARLLLAGASVHVVQRGNNRLPCFHAVEDYRYYLECLATFSKRFDCAVHAYVLMTNHVHLLLTSRDPANVSRMMKFLGQHHTQHINRKYDRSGTLWEGRFKSCLVQEDNYVLACYRYIESNPVRACMAQHPSSYRWSSYRVNALGYESAIVLPHAGYMGLAGDETRRQAAYAGLFTMEDAPRVKEIRQATDGNLLFGSAAFQRTVESGMGRQTAPARRGRPPKQEIRVCP